MKKVTPKIVTKSYSSFNVHNIADNYSFYHIDITDTKKFFEGLCAFLLNEDNLIRYSTNKSAVRFEPTVINFIKVYRELNNFIDEENLDSFEFDVEIEAVISEEFGEIEEENGKKLIRASKIGRIGEYIFHIFLSDYFGFNCIIPKVKLTTDRNMSIHGIDVLFLNKKDETILFGESKVTNKIENGIVMINKSLQNYEKEIREEYMLILTNNHLKLNGLEDVFPGQTEVCLTFDDFIKSTQIKYIGVPIFIAHGTELDYEVILDSLEKKIKRKKYFNLETKYYVISLPIISKKVFMEYITSVIRRKMEEYNASVNKR